MIVPCDSLDFATLGRPVLPATGGARARKPRVCFVAPTTYPVLARDRSIREVGGAQVQQSFLARGLAERGYSVSMISLNYGQPKTVELDGITVHRAHAMNEGLPVIRFVHPNLTSIWDAMLQADADIYYQRAAGALTAFMVAFAKRHKRLSIYAAASDRDFFRPPPHLSNVRDRTLFQWAVRHVDLLVAQTEAQRVSCVRNFSREPVVIRSCYAHKGRDGSHDGVILWVGNILPVKRPDLFVELARRLPSYRFKLVGGRDDSLIEPLRLLAAGLGNIEFTGFVPFADIEQHFDGASLFINTSLNEGFPNTFLQAWSRGVPTISMFDPGAWLGSHRVGEVVPDLAAMVEEVQALKSNHETWRLAGTLAKEYFEGNYSIDGALDSYERQFESALC